MVKPKEKPGENPYESPRTNSQPEDLASPIDSRTLTTSKRLTSVAVGIFLQVVGAFNLYVALDLKMPNAMVTYGTFLHFFLIFAGFLHLFVGIRGKTLTSFVHFSLIGIGFVVSILLAVYLAWFHK